MSVYDAMQTGRSARSRRCAKCTHINPSSYLVCRECNTILSNSEWVDLPPLARNEVAKVSEVAKPKTAAEKITHFQSMETPIANEQTIRIRPAAFSGLRAKVAHKETNVQNHTAETIDEEATTQEMPIKNEQAPEPVGVVNNTKDDTQPTRPKEMPTMRETMSVPQVNVNQVVEPPIEAREETLYAPIWNKSKKFQEGTSVFEATMILCIEISKSGTPIVLRLPQQRALVFGRDDPETSERPDIDLIPYGGFSMGISRRHAALELVGKRLSIRDLKSSNGTFLNDVRLDAHEPHQLRDGDRVRFGSLVLLIFFKQ